MMNAAPSSAGISRRDALKLAAGGLASAAVASAVPFGADIGAAWGASPGRPSPSSADWAIPVARIEDIINAKGTVSNGVLNIEIDRDDIPDVVKRPFGVPIKPAFEINGNLCFQSLGRNMVMFNGDLCFKPDELNPAVHQALKHGLAFQAMHQHLFDLSPMVWFMHFRARGDAEHIARGLKAVLDATSTPFPQAPPQHPMTPLDPGRLGKIIGAMPTVGGSGVVSFEVPRANPIHLEGLHINPYLNVYTPIAFEPLDSSGSKAAVVPDFGMVYTEIPRLMTVMQSQGWEVDCLYNQETDEQPQLYFSHQFKAGDPYELAREVRRGLEQLDVTLH
jgi:hypothetical protein